VVGCGWSDFGLAKRKGVEEMTISPKFTSRKFWMAVISALLIIANEGLDLNIPTKDVLAVTALVLGWIFSEAYVDAHRS